MIWRFNARPWSLALLCAACLLPPLAEAGPLRDWLQRRGSVAGANELDDSAESSGGAFALPAGARLIRDVAYGTDPAQRFDVYQPAHAQGAPIVVMVHGGAWAIGDKAHPAVVANKATRWLGRGFVFVSVNYRMLPSTPPLEQARDVARALAVIQRDATRWGGDGAQLVLMGHSAGAHLVALLSADPALARAQGARPWLGAVLLDSAALDVEAIMQVHHFGLYDRAFGGNPADWQAASPLVQLQGASVPMLAVCSSQRRLSCRDAQGFAAKANRLGGHARVLAENLSHGQINEQLGLAGDYTTQVEDFMLSLSPALATRLAGAD